MADTLSTEKRSWNMSRIKSQNTKIELAVRKHLFSKGFRYRINVRNLPGKPDIVLKKYNTVVFIHGCFWHRHQGCKDATTPKTKTSFWENKFHKNVKNDQKHVEMLQQTGWRVVTIWECEIENHFDSTMIKLIDKIKL